MKRNIRLLLSLAIVPVLFSVLWATNVQVYKKGPTGNETTFYTLDDSGNLTISGALTAASTSITGTQTNTGAQTNNGAVTNNSSVTNKALVNYVPVQEFGMTASSSVIPTASYMVLGGTVTTGNEYITALPSISTSTSAGGSAYADGTYLVLGSTAAAGIVLQDNGTLSGSRLYLGAATRQVGNHKVLTLIYNAALNFWTELSYANNN